jgi:hypothetical protein
MKRKIFTPKRVISTHSLDASLEVSPNKKGELKSQSALMFLIRINANNRAHKHNALAAVPSGLPPKSHPVADRLSSGHPPRPNVCAIPNIPASRRNRAPAKPRSLHFAAAVALH